MDVSDVVTVVQGLGAALVLIASAIYVVAVFSSTFRWLKGMLFG